MYIFKALRGIGSTTITFRQNGTITGRNTRQADHIEVSRCRLDLTKQRIGFAGPNEYNKLPSSLRNISAVATFKRSLKNYLLQNLETLLI